MLHQHNQRQWLRGKGKHHYIDFSDAERAGLRTYFDALANDGDRIDLASLENMLISLGLAETRQEVRGIVEEIDDNGNGELDFDEYLEIFRKRTDSEIYQVFKAMMEGKLGDQNLNFQTVISNYRRNLFIEATGASTNRGVRLPSDNMNMPQEQGSRILHNFATLQRSRYAEALAAHEKGLGPPVDEDALSFDVSGHVPPGSLGMLWRTVTHDRGLVSSQPSAFDPSKLGVPQSPRTVINNICKAPRMKKRQDCFGRTIVIPAPALEEGSNSGAEW